MLVKYCHLDVVYGRAEQNYTRAGKPWTGVCTWGVQGLKPCHSPSVPLVPPAAPPRPGQLLLPPHCHHAQAQVPHWTSVFRSEALQRQCIKHNSDQCMPKFPLSSRLSESPLSVLLWLYCRVGGVHSLRGGAAEVRRVRSHGAFWKRVLHGPLVKKAP